MPYSDTVFLDYLIRAEKVRGETRADIQELKATVLSQSEAAAQGRKDIHKRIDRLEDHTRAELKDIRSELAKSPSRMTFFSAVSHIAEKWRTYLAALCFVAGVLMGKSPAEVRQTFQSWTGYAK
jgi:hypothetical protein